MIDDLTVRHPGPDDHARVRAVLDRWWGGFGGDAGSRERALLLPRLYFQHFATTSYLAEHPDGELAAFLIGFLSQSDPDVAYIHFAGVDPALHGRGVGSALYRRFFDVARAHGRRRVHCVTSPGNTGSQAFHRRLGFDARIQEDYDGPGLDRVVFAFDLADDVRRSRLRVLDTVFALEHHAGQRQPPDDSWHALVRAPAGLTVIRDATPGAERWIGLYDADPDHGLDVPGLLAAVIQPLAEAAVPVFVASTYHADLVLVPEARRDDALAALRAARHEVYEADLAPR